MLYLTIYLIGFVLTFCFFYYLLTKEVDYKNDDLSKELSVPIMLGLIYGFFWPLLLPVMLFLFLLANILPNKHSKKTIVGWCENFNDLMLFFEQMAEDEFRSNYCSKCNRSCICHTTDKEEYYDGGVW